jgi:hypothetical protein
VLLFNSLFTDRENRKNVVLGFIFDRFVFFREIQSNEQHEKRVNELMKKV